MKLDKNTGVKANFRAFLMWSILTVLFCFLAVKLVYGTFFPSSASLREVFFDDIRYILAIVISANISLLIVRCFYQLYLEHRAYRTVGKGEGWQAFKASEEDRITGGPDPKGAGPVMEVRDRRDPDR